MAARTRATLKTICTRTGLSVATVSKALRGSEQVRRETREIVEAAAREVGYAMNLSGLQLRTGKTYQIAAVFTVPQPDTEEWEGVEYTQLLSGISRALENTPYRIGLNAVQDDAEALAVIRRVVERGEADGVILSGTRPEDERVSYLQDHDFPFVTYGTTSAHGSHPFVDADNAGLMKIAVRRLVSKGHRRIALINPPAKLSYAQTRRQVWQETLSALGLSADPSLVQEGILTPGFGFNAVSALASMANPPTAYVCANEAAALGALSAFAERGMVHGRDAVINATDDLNISAYFVPPLTTFYLPINELATLLGQFILGRLENRPVPELQRLILPTLVERCNDILKP